MGKNTNTIEINGKKYDAKTGDLLHASAHSAGATHAQPHPKAEEKGAVKNSPARETVQHGARHTPQKSRTLIRHAVKKPASAKSIKAVGHTDHLAKRTLPKLVVKHPARSVDVRRAGKAHVVPKSNLITHFIPVSAMPGPSYEAPAFNPSAEAITPVQPLAAASPKPSGRPRSTADLLDLAVQHARSHEQPPVHHKPRHKRRLKGAALSAAALLLLSFVGWQQLPDMRLQMASAKAGFNVNRPGYMPAGYSLGDMKYAQGAAALSFHSNSDDRQYTLTQRESGWSSQNLLDNFVLSRGENYQAVESEDRTVYLYGNGNATWVNKGVWYVIQGDGSLSQRQLVELAASL